MTGNTGTNLADNVTAALSAVKADCARIGATAGIDAPQPDIAQGADRAHKAAMDPSILKGLAGATHVGSAHKPVVGTETAKLANRSNERSNGIG